MASNPNEYNKQNWEGLNDLSGLGEPIDIGPFDFNNIGKIDPFAGMETEDDVRRVYGDDEFMLKKFRELQGETPEQKEERLKREEEDFNKKLAEQGTNPDPDPLASLDELNAKLYGQDLDPNDPNYWDIIHARASGTEKGLEQGMNQADAGAQGIAAGQAVIARNAPKNSAIEETAKTGEAIAQGAQEAQQAAEASAQKQASAGINRSRAGMLSDQGAEASQTTNVANNYTMAKQQTGATQADYLNKMNQADALSQQANNIQRGAGLTALGGGLQAGATGLKAGMSLFGGGASNKGGNQ